MEGRETELKLQPGPQPLTEKFSQRQKRDYEPWERSRGACLVKLYEDGVIKSVHPHPKNLAMTLRISSLERELGLSLLAQARPG